MTLCSTSVYNKLSGQCPWKRFLHSALAPPRGERQRDGGGRAGESGRGGGEIKF